MLRQQIRLKDIEEILRTDKGTDPGLDAPIQLTREPVFEEYYDSWLNDLLTRARDEELAGGSIGGMLHFGAAYSTDPVAASKGARVALSLTLGDWFSKLPAEISEVEEEYSESVPRAKRLMIVRPVRNDLYNSAARAFPMWMISSENRKDLVCRRLQIDLCLDPAGFIALARSLGIPSGFTSRRAAAKMRDAHG